jgi:hypothetical protein
MPPWVVCVWQAWRSGREQREAWLRICPRAWQNQCIIVSQVEQAFNLLNKYFSSEQTFLIFAPINHDRIHP